MYKLCFDFFHHQADLKSINHSYITLVPKKDNPEKVNDFRPISLLNSSINMVTKLLANRLQTLAMEIVHENQYGFIKGKTIQDCLGWAFEFLHQCHHSRREIIILKLDFEKAFDLIEHSAVLAMLQAKGFPQKWIMWINELLSSETSFVLLNGTAGKDFKCIRGVRQGDPLSPLLFAIDADLLQCAINKEYEIGNLHPPFPQRTENPFPIIQYADDTIIIMQGCDSQLAILKDILNKISVSSSLVVNFHKSCLVPINISSEHASSLAQSFGCTVGSFPFTYLGLSMGLNKPQVKDYAPLNCRIERKLAAASLHLSYAARLQLVNSVISSLPTYYMCTLKLPITVLTLLISTRRTAFGEAENSIEKDTIWLLGTWSENQRIKEVLVLLI
jgi:retron-type reverse transcriptase